MRNAEWGGGSVGALAEAQGDLLEGGELGVVNRAQRGGGGAAGGVAGDRAARRGRRLRHRCRRGLHRFEQGLLALGELAHGVGQGGDLRGDLVGQVDGRGRRRRRRRGGGD